VARPSDTARLTFAEITVDDLDDMSALLGDPRVMRYDPPPMTRDEVREWIEWNQGTYTDPGFGIWLLRLRSTSEFVGDCGLTLQEVGADIAVEIEFHLRADLHGNGYATEAAFACRDFAATVLDLERLIGIIAVDNIAPQRIVEKIGMRREGVIEHEGRPAVLYGGDPIEAHRTQV
jgi:RimJ/RimL family protein N-acetyltransferase